MRRISVTWVGVDWRKLAFEAEMVTGDRQVYQRDMNWRGLAFKAEMAMGDRRCISLTLHGLA